MFDTDKFIESVHGEPALWDKAAPEYSNKDSRQRAWVNVGECMYPEWARFTCKERDNEIKQLKNKWRHIRDGFTRSLNKGKSGDAASSTKKKYTYADSLAFLLNTLEKRKTSGNLEHSDDDDKQDDAGGMGEPGVSDIDDENSEKQPEPSTQTTGFPNRQKRKRPISSSLTSFQSQLLNKLTETKDNEVDGDKLFLLSILPDYQKLNDDEKLDFKFMTLQFFRDIRAKSKARNQPGNRFVPPNFQFSCPGPGMSVQAPHPQNLMNMYSGGNYSTYQNLMSPNDSQLSTGSSASSNLLMYSSDAPSNPHSLISPNDTQLTTASSPPSSY